MNHIIMDALNVLWWMARQNLVPWTLVTELAYKTDRKEVSVREGHRQHLSVGGQNSPPGEQPQPLTCDMGEKNQWKENSQCSDKGSHVRLHRDWWMCSGAIFITWSFTVGSCSYIGLGACSKLLFCSVVCSTQTTFWICSLSRSLSIPHWFTVDRDKAINRCFVYNAVFLV